MRIVAAAAAPAARTNGWYRLRPRLRLRGAWTPPSWPQRTSLALIVVVCHSISLIVHLSCAPTSARDSLRLAPRATPSSIHTLSRSLVLSLSLDYSRSQAFVLLSNKNNNSQRFSIIYRTIIEYRLFINHGYANVTAEERELSANQ